MDRLVVITFLLTASATFALYRKELEAWRKMYFGFFLFYPLLALLTLCIDRLMFAIIASPLIITLTVPETKFSNKDFDIREPVGILSGSRIQLIKKGAFTETSLGICKDLDVDSLVISSVSITSQSTDSTVATITSSGKRYQATFYKRL